MEGLSKTHTGVSYCLVLILHWITLCNTQDIRLVEGSGSFEGRVEVLVQGQWGTVCHDNWDNNDVTVVCRQLGNRTARSSQRQFGPGLGPIWWNDVACTGLESTLAECQRIELSEGACQHNMDAGAECTPKDNDLRLVGGSAPHEGRVEIYRENVPGWGQVCEGATWGMREATVACHQVGYINGSAVDWSRDFGPGDGPGLLFNVQCLGSEDSLTNCSHTAPQSTPQSTPPSCPGNVATVVCKTVVVNESLSVQAIVGIAVGFGLVLIICCIFSLNCKCRCLGKSETDDQGAYECNTGSQNENRVYSTSDVMSNSQTVNSTTATNQTPSQLDDSNVMSDADLFMYAPKVQPAQVDDNKVVNDADLFVYAPKVQPAQIDDNKVMSDADLFMYAPKVQPTVIGMTSPLEDKTEDNNGIGVAVQDEFTAPPSNHVGGTPPTFDANASQDDIGDEGKLIQDDLPYEIETVDTWL